MVTRNIIRRSFSRRRSRLGEYAGVECLERRFALAVITVTNTFNAGAGSLRQAILDSNAAPGADTINFNATFNSAQTILITSPLPQVGDVLSIVGSGPSLLTIRLSTVSSSVAGIFSSTSSNLTLSGMTLTGANVSGGGGGLQSTGPGSKIVTLDNMVFTGNTVSTLGGAVFLNNNTALNISNCTFLNNTATSGGGICFFDNGSLSMDNCTFSGNVSTATASGAARGSTFSGQPAPLQFAAAPSTTTHPHAMAARSWSKPSAGISH